MSADIVTFPAPAAYCDAARVLEAHRALQPGLSRARQVIAVFRTAHAPLAQDGNPISLAILDTLDKIAWVLEQQQET